MDTRTNTERHQQARELLIRRIDQMAAGCTEDELGRLAWFEQQIEALLCSHPPMTSWPELRFRMIALAQQDLVEPREPNTRAN